MRSRIMGGMLAILGVLATSCMNDPRAAAERAIGATRSEKSYSTKFKAEIRIPNSDPLDITGESLWVSPGVLYIHYKGSAGDEKWIVRAGERVWMYHEFAEEWVSPDQMGNPGAARGVQNPDEVLGVLAKHLETAKDGGEDKTGKVACSIVEVPLAGADIEKIMKEQASQGSFEWKESKADVKLWIAEGRIAKFTSAADLTSTNPEIKGRKVRYAAEVEVTGYGTGTEMKFQIVDETTKKPVDLKIPAEIQKAIAEEMKKGR